VGLVDCRTIVLAPGKAFPFQLDFLNALRGHGDFIVPKTRGLVKDILSRISTLRYLHEGLLAYFEIFEGDGAFIALHMAVID
jgi:hypothetical protein